MRNYYVPGDWNAICDRCGLKKKASMLRLEWTGLRVCGGCFETRHPQTLIRVPKEDTAVPWSRPESVDTFVEVSYPITTEADVFLFTETGIIINTEG